MKQRNPEVFKEIGAWLGGFVKADDGKYQVIREMNDDGQEARRPEVGGRGVERPGGGHRTASARASAGWRLLARAPLHALEEAWRRARRRGPA